MKNFLFNSLFSSESCVFFYFFSSSLEKVHFMALYNKKIGVWVAPRQRGIHSKPDLLQKSILYIVFGTLTMCAWLKCVYAYACMCAHLGFPTAFLFQK